MRGQMYDYYLDPNACLYGLHTAGEPLHIMLNLADSSVMVANNTFETHRDMMLLVMLVDMNGKKRIITQVFSEIGPTTVKKYLSVARALERAAKDEGCFLALRLLDLNKQPISDNLYWLSDSTGNYSGIQNLKSTELNVVAEKTKDGEIKVTLTNPDEKPVAFFNRISLINYQTKERILPTFCSDNYVSVLPGESKTIIINYTTQSNVTPEVEIDGWNTGKHQYEIK
jgi:hypothetical protein